MIKNVVFALLAVFVLAGCASIEQPVEFKELQLYGTIIDNACAVQHKNDMDQFSKTYSTEQALNCTIGYAFYSATGIQEFDPDSNIMIDKYLRSQKSDVNVQIRCYESKKKLHLLEILAPINK